MANRIFVSCSLSKYGSILTFTALAALAAAQANQPMHLFTLGSPVMNVDRAGVLGNNFNLTRKAGTQFNGGVYEMADGSVRGVFKGDGNPFMYVAPDLPSERGPAPTAAQGQSMVLNFCRQFSLFTNDTIHFTDSGVWTKQDGSATGGAGKPTDMLRTFRLRHFMDGLPVYGPASELTLDVDSQGVVGFTDSLRNLVPFETIEPAAQKTQPQIDLEFNLKATRQANGGAYKMLSKKLIYFEQGLKFVQPVWLYDVQFTRPSTAGGPGETSANFVLVPAVQNSPEIIYPEFPGLVSQPIFPNPPPAGAAPEASLDLSQWFASTAVQANPVRVGEYIVRNDDAGWLNDANAFWSNLVFTSTISLHPGVSRVDYWWNMPWCWYPALGIPDNSPNFVGHDHFALIEGHGAPWEITTYQNWGDFIYLDLINGYGTHKVPGEQTAYVMWQSCDVVPQPGHPYEARFTSPHSAFDVWFKIMRGMRGNFGYRTLMHIWNGVGSLFGFREGLGIPNVAGWLDATDHGVFGHSGGLDYGSCVIVTGHESDTFYNTDQLPDPGSLTMWWIHA